MLLLILDLKNIVDESPWPFLSSTTSQFLTLGVVMFFQLVCLNEKELIFEEKMFGIGPRAIVEFLGNRYYSLQTMGYGKVIWDPNKISPAAIKIIKIFEKQLKENDKDKVYDTMCYILNNENGVFTQGFGKVCNTINGMIYEHNKRFPEYKISEQEYLDKHGYNYKMSDLDFLGKKTKGTILTNVYEVLTPKVLENQNPQLSVSRFRVSSGHINLSGQYSPDCSVGTPNLIFYGSDIKVLDEDSFLMKIWELQQDQNPEYMIKNLGGLSTFGFNIFVVAKQSENLVLTEEQIKCLDIHITNNVAKYPELFKNFDPDSDVYKAFLATGNTRYLNQLNHPCQRILYPEDFRVLEYDKDSVKKSYVYKQFEDILKDMGKNDS